ncbi:FolC bifunctional protein [Hypoxylon trugodes]|uniref:FolC bifunctional protein n=1 Tax=Hypoxylon trugodes TaxID=326681 RepID=UPI002195AE0F|nr:FolC bifunctional protein [Hypoxylon trugodes]KAI1392906.1 FolC bifunctional protein [Hypoxylon trugodes]
MRRSVAACFATIRKSYTTSSILRKPTSSFTITTITTSLRYSSTMARTYESALQYLESLQSNKFITSQFVPPSIPSSTSSTPDDLNSRAIPEMLAWIQRGGVKTPDLSRLRMIHVAGTKGKGSVCAYLTSILLHSKDSNVGKIGTYTSPHLLSVRERVQIGGQPINKNLFTQYFFEVWDHMSQAARDDQNQETKSEEWITGPETKPFYFRFLTVMALYAFIREGVTSVVLECGIGGEYDSTNAIPADAVTAAVITQLGIDHVGMLGATVPRIAWHKAGVCKEGRKCFTRKLEGTKDKEETMEVLRQRAAEKKATLVGVLDKEVEKWGGVKGDTTGSLEGEFQKYNQALALKAANEHIRVLSGKLEGQPEDESLVALGERFSEGLRLARLRGRCETREDRGIDWYIDGAHTADSLEEVAKWFAGKYKSLAPGTRVALLFNQQERDVAKLLGSLIRGIRQELGYSEDRSIFTDAIFTRNDLHPRRADEPEARDRTVQIAAAKAFGEFCPGVEAHIVDNVNDAVTTLSALKTNNGNKCEVAVLATGSLHLVGALLKTLEPDAES